jgi:peptide/nickel transport system substrate-binding protein
MRTRFIRLRFRRRIRKGQQQVEDLGVQAEQQIERHLFKRFGRLLPIRRFVAAWLGLLLLLIGGVVAQNLALSGYYQTLRTVPGGIYNEGLQGRFTNANPIYATSDVDTTVSRLIFAGLFSYDDQGKLVGDLASSYSVDARGTTYTVHLKPRLTWQDGRPLTSSDVLFTYQLIQNPDTQSPLQNSWTGITVTAPDPQTVVFKLPNILASFPSNLTNGIVPRHLLASIPPSDMRSADFNTVNPIGAGPFTWQAIQVTGNGDPDTTGEQIGLVPFAGYQGGKPKLQKFVVQVFATDAQLVSAFKGNQLTAAEGLTDLPAGLAGDRSVMQHSLILRAANMVFFKTSAGVLAQQPVRQALVQATNVPAIIKQLGYPTREVREPLLLGQLGYDPSLAQPSFDLAAAKATLASNDWLPGPDHILAKAGQPLSFTLTAADTSEDQLVTRLLQEQWSQLGVKLNVQLLDPIDFQSSLTYHNYDAILNGISIGTDPDVFVYWDSSQADVRSANRLNLSEYKNPTADTALEAGRTRLDPALRVIKYKPFLQAWQQDLPSLGLYQPRVLYLTNGQVSGLSDNAINTPPDRFANVQNWEIRQAKVTN